LSEADGNRARRDDGGWEKVMNGEQIGSRDWFSQYNWEVISDAVACLKEMKQEEGRTADDGFLISEAIMLMKDLLADAELKGFF
jgi:hypothetical protein